MNSIKSANNGGSGGMKFSARKLNNKTAGTGTGTGTRQVSVKKDASLVVMDEDTEKESEQQHQQQQASAAASAVLPSRELTRSDKYIVSKLTNIPSVLEDTRISKGLIKGKFAIAINTDSHTINVWNYIDDSKSSVPIALSFPYDSNPYGLPPFVALIDNDTDASDPGLVIIDSYTGVLKYYQSINNAPALNVLNFKILELNLKLNQEFVTIIKYVKDLGIFIGTSNKKIMLITLKDNFNKPHLTNLQVTTSTTSSWNGLLGSFFNSSSKNYDSHDFYQKNNRIVAIEEVDWKQQQQSSDNNQSHQQDHGLKHIIFQESDGSFELWKFNTTVTTMSPILRSNLKQPLSSFLSDIYDNVQFSFKILDVLPLQHITSANVFLVLASFNKDNNPNLKALVLFTVKITSDNDVLIYGTYRLTSYVAKPQDIPKLVLPSKSKTCFVVVNNCVVLTEVITTVDPMKLVQATYKTKWEDAITLKNPIEIVGFGSNAAAAAATTTTNLIVMTSTAGLLNIDITTGSTLDDEDDNDNDNDEAELNLRLQQEPMLFIKSHIEQAIYYGGNKNDDPENPVLFQIPATQDFNSKDIENAILKVLTQILTNDSNCLPKVYPSVEDFLEKRNSIVQNLMEFLIANFKDLSVDLKILMLNILNKFKIALIFYRFIKSNDEYMQSTQSILSSGADFNNDSTKEDTIRFFFFNQVTEIPDLCSKFIEAVMKDNTPPSSKVLSLLNDIGTSYLNFERTLRYNQLAIDVEYEVVSNNKPFLIENDSLLVNILNFYKSIESSNNNKLTFTVEQREQFVNVSQFLFYAFNDVLSYCHSQDDISSRTSNLKEIYDANKNQIIEILCQSGFAEFVLKVSELYKDMNSIAEVIITNKIESDRLTYFFDKFGYQFASQYYENLIKRKQFQNLFNPISDSDTFLPLFFDQNDNYNRLHWIYQIMQQNYDKASSILIELQEKNDNHSIVSKQFDLNLAKLTALQHGGHSSDYHILEEINFQSTLCQIQQDFILTDDDISTAVSSSVLQKWKANQVLSIEELIDLLSSTKSELNFQKAYSVVKKLNNEEEFKLLFTRLLLSDNWEFLNDKNKTDEFLTSTIKSTVTYNTINVIVQQTPNLELNIKNLLHKRIDRIDELQLSEQDQILKKLDDTVQLNDWIQSMISLSKTDS